MGCEAEHSLSQRSACPGLGTGRHRPKGGRGEAAPEFPSGIQLAKFLVTLASRCGRPDSLVSRTGDQGAGGGRWAAWLAGQ